MSPHKTFKKCHNRKEPNKIPHPVLQEPEFFSTTSSSSVGPASAFIFPGAGCSPGNVFMDFCNYSVVLLDVELYLPLYNFLWSCVFIPLETGICPIFSPLAIVSIRTFLPLLLYTSKVLPWWLKKKKKFIGRSWPNGIQGQKYAWASFQTQNQRLKVVKIQSCLSSVLCSYLFLFPLPIVASLHFWSP